ncbi:MAG: helicase-associated domain-containing protein, partial [Candidatus Hinthialibacter sp.]
MSDSKPVIVQSDKTVFLEVDSPVFDEARDALCAFAELTKCPEHIHTYVISPLSLWNAASAGLTSEDVLRGLNRFSRYPTPSNVETDIREYMSRYGRLTLERRGDDLVLRSEDPMLLDQISRHKKTHSFIEERLDLQTVKIGGAYRGRLKQSLIKIGFPIKDQAGYVEGEPLQIDLRAAMLSGKAFQLRDYQKDAVSSFYRDGGSAGGSGVVVLPCGSGKTVIGLGVLAKLRRQTLILVTNVVALRQWKREILDKTTLTEDEVGEYSGECK